MASMSGMTMSSSTMAMAASASMTGMSMPSSTASSHGSMGMGGMGGMGGGACKISMLWNWYTIDACFIFRNWHVRSAGAFAGTCIGVLFLAITLEFIRRGQREFDRYLAKNIAASRVSRRESTENITHSESETSSKEPRAIITRANGGAVDYFGHLKLWQQAVRSFLFTLQFAASVFIMLLLMLYNGYIIFMIFIGCFIGAMVFQWDTFNPLIGPEQADCC